MPFKNDMPPMLLLIALVMVVGEFAPFKMPLTLLAGTAVWHMAQLAV